MITIRRKSGDTIVIGNKGEIIIEFGSVMGNTIEVRVTTPDGLPVRIDGIQITPQDKETTARTKDNYGPYREIELKTG